MVIFCEECGERYVIEDDEMKGSAMIFICSVCNEIIRIQANKTKMEKQEEKADSPVKNS